jgi:cell shape-determining protein MreC
MTYLLKRNKQNPFDHRILKSLAVVLPVLMLVIIFGFSQSARSSVSDLFLPFLKTGNYFYKTIDNISANFTSKNELISENAKLSSEIENNVSDMSDLESIKYENQKLREALKMRPVGENVTAIIVARPPQIPLDSLLINGGTNNEIFNNSFVLVGERNLIGKVVEVSKNKSTVVLDTFAGVVTHGFVARTDEIIEIKGTGGGLEAKMPIDFDIKVGDKIMVNGSAVYLAAVVGAIEEDRSLGFKNVFLSLPVDMSKINMVFVESLTD